MAGEAWLASVPGLPRFDLPFVFTIIHGIGIMNAKWKVKMGEAWKLG